MVDMSCLAGPIAATWLLKTLFCNDKFCSDGRFRKALRRNGEQHLGVPATTPGGNMGVCCRCCRLLFVVMAPTATPIDEFLIGYENTDLGICGWKPDEKSSTGRVEDTLLQAGLCQRFHFPKTENSHPLNSLSMYGLIMYSTSISGMYWNFEVTKSLTFSWWGLFSFLDFWNCSCLRSCQHIIPSCLAIATKYVLLP